MSKTIVSLMNVEKWYGDNHVVKNMNVNIAEGEFLTLLGPSGCGKTTTLRMISGFELPTMGMIKVQGESVEKKEPYQRDVNTVFQNYALFPNMNVFDNVAFAMRAIGASASSIKKRVPYILELVGLKNKMKNKPSELSGGEQQRVSLARALVNNPEIIIADEPTGNVDPEMSHDIIQLLSEINDMGTTVLVVTHEHELVRQFNKRVIDHGRVKSDTKNPEAALAYDAQYEDIDEIIEGIALSKETKENFVDNDVVPD